MTILNCSRLLVLCCVGVWHWCCCHPRCHMTLLPASSLWLSLPHLYAKRGHNSFVPRYTPPAFFDDCRHHKLGLLHGLRSAPCWHFFSLHFFEVVERLLYGVVRPEKRPVGHRQKLCLTSLISSLMHIYIYFRMPSPNETQSFGA